MNKTLLIIYLFVVIVGSVISIVGLLTSISFSYKRDVSLPRVGYVVYLTPPYTNSDTNSRPYSSSLGTRYTIEIRYPFEIWEEDSKWFTIFPKETYVSTDDEAVKIIKMRILLNSISTVDPTPFEIKHYLEAVSRVSGGTVVIDSNYLRSSSPILHTVQLEFKDNTSPKIIGPNIVTHQLRSFEESKLEGSSSLNPSDEILFIPEKSHYPVWIDLGFGKYQKDKEKSTFVKGELVITLEKTRKLRSYR